MKPTQLAINRTDGGVSFMTIHPVLEDEFLQFCMEMQQKNFVPDIRNFAVGQILPHQKIQGELENAPNYNAAYNAAKKYLPDLYDFMVNKWDEPHVIDGASQIVSWKVLPADYDERSHRWHPYRNAFTHDGKGTDHRFCMVKAAALHMDKIREKRNARLVELDKRKYGSDFDAERQQLRDLPQTFDLSGAKDYRELETLWPQQLK